ncbi:MAG: Rpn family recombination-promoting nuclease/putative transposase [Candidatus Symbiothrix sp.]|nr:Rpn family recombination-promoting nuclease/putative transposase [Candidatus Symbiothrix sp.]
MKKVNPKQKNRKLGTFMNFQTDFAFKKILENERLLIDFLNETLGYECKVASLDYLKSEQLGKTEEDRKAVYDIYCKNERGECFIIEMQVAYQKHYFDRILFYATFPIQKYAVKGKWDFELKPLYCISIVDFEIFGKNNYLNHVDFVRREAMEIATKKVNFIIIELPKFQKTLRQSETRLDWWIYCIKHLGQLKKQPAKLHNEIFDELFETARINKLKKEDMGQYKKSVTEYADVKVCMRDFGELNMEKGLKKGMLAKTKEIVKNSLKEGLSPDILSRITGLTPEQINEMR